MYPKVVFIQKFKIQFFFILGGLGQSLYAPKFMLGQHTPEALHKFVRERFVSSNIVISSVGLEQRELLELVTKNFVFAGSQPSKCKSNYIGGQIHLSSNSPVTYVALASEGVG